MPWPSPPRRPARPLAGCRALELFAGPPRSSSRYLTQHRGTVGPGAQDRNLVAKHDDFDGEVLLLTPREPNQLERTDEGNVEEGECHAPSSSSVSRQQKSRSMGPDDVFGTHTFRNST